MKYSGKRTKNLTLSIDHKVLADARQRARCEGTTINDVVREALTHYADHKQTKEAYQDLMKRLGTLTCNRKFTRDEMHER